MVTDKQLLDEVRAALHDEVADVAASSALLSKVHRRRRTRRRWLVTVPVAAAVAVAVPLLPGPPPPQSPPSAQQPPATRHQSQVDVTLAAERTMSALNEVTDGVIRERTTVTEGEKYSEPGETALYERWLPADGSSFRLVVTIDGKPVVDLSRDRVSNVFVDHRTRSYRVFPGMEPNPPQYDDVWTAKEIQQSLAQGDLTVVGPGEPVNGKPTILLRQKAGKAEVPIKLWIDATTYLPVRWQWIQENSTPFDVAYLPPTPENRAQLTTVIPPGFTKEN